MDVIRKEFKRRRYRVPVKIARMQFNLILPRVSMAIINRVCLCSWLWLDNGYNEIM